MGRNIRLLDVSPGGACSGAPRTSENMLCFWLACWPRLAGLGRLGLAAAAWCVLRWPLCSLVAVRPLLRCGLLLRGGPLAGLGSLGSGGLARLRRLCLCCAGICARWWPCGLCCAAAPCCAGCVGLLRWLFLAALALAARCGLAPSCGGPSCCASLSPSFDFDSAPARASLEVLLSRAQ